MNRLRKGKGAEGGRGAEEGEKEESSSLTSFFLWRTERVEGGRERGEGKGAER